MTELEHELIEYFISFVQLLGMPKSVGEICGLLFMATKPLSMDAVVARLRISKGSAGSGLSLLRELGTVQRVSMEGDGRDRFVPDLDLVKVVGVFFRQKLPARLESVMERLDRMEGCARRRVDEAEGSGEDEQGVLIRVRALQVWQARDQKVLPLLLRLLKK